jgi:hypothetical protein
MNKGIRPALTLIPGHLDEQVEWSWFCGHCAAPPPGRSAPPPNARVCRQCGFGLLLETPADALPAANDAFVVVDSALLVQAMSAHAEKLLGVREDDAVNCALGELLVPAAAELGGQGGFAAAIADAVATSDRPAYAFVRPSNTFGVRIRARIGACGPPRAALIVLERPPRSGRLKAVSPQPR